MDLENEPLTTVEEVIRELKSGYGSSTSSIAPCKEIQSVELVQTEYNMEKREMLARIAVHAYRQSPYGDSANTSRTFFITRKDAAQLAACAPSHTQQFRHVAEKLDILKEVSKARAEEEKAAVVSTILEGTDRPLLVRKVRFKPRH